MPEPLDDPLINYLVLGVAFMMEASSLAIAVRDFARDKPPALGWWRAVRESKDPSTFIVLFEDSAALAGLGVAALGVWASHHFADARLDGAASIVIGLMLGVVAAFLAREAKGLLIGERTDPRVIELIRRTVAAHPGIAGVNHVRTVHTSPDRVFVAISADFDDDLTMGEGEALIDAIETELRAAEPSLASIYIRPETRESAATLPPARA